MPDIIALWLVLVALLALLLVWLAVLAVLAPDPVTRARARSLLRELRALITINIYLPRRRTRLC